MTRLGRIVLVVNKNSASRYVACHRLRRANFSTIEASWGREAVEQARRFRPDTIILDMDLPDQSGIETLQQLRADPYTASIPVVFLTASADFFGRSQAERLGVSAYLFDPIASDSLVTVVEGSIRRASDDPEAFSRVSSEDH